MTLSSPGDLPVFQMNLLPTTSIFISYTLKLGAAGSFKTLLNL
jgi:hypothetical protein